jgi:ribosomal protein S18 acetylase RimI-like enzyme
LLEGEELNRIILDNDPRDFLDYREGSGGSIEIFDIQVGSERGKGKGRRLIEALFSRLKPETRVWAITRAENEVAQKFYEKLCFDVVSPLRRFYTSHRGVDALLYIRRAGGPV